MKKFPGYVFASFAFSALALAQAAAPPSAAKPPSTTFGVETPQIGQTGKWRHKPYVYLTWTSVQMTATVTTNSSGREASGPGVASIYECTTTPATACTRATLGQSEWQLLPPAPGTTCTVGKNNAPCSVTQSTPSGCYVDTLNVRYGQTRNYVVTNTWDLEGGASGYSNIAQAQVVRPAGQAVAHGCPAAAAPAQP